MVVVGLVCYHRVTDRGCNLVVAAKNLFFIQVSKPQLHGVVRHGVHRDLRSFSKFPLFFHWEGSRVGQVYIATGDPTWAQNLKMGIASLLQVQRESGARVEVSQMGFRLVCCETACGFGKSVAGFTRGSRSPLCHTLGNCSLC